MSIVSTLVIIYLIHTFINPVYGDDHKWPVSAAKRIQDEIIDGDITSIPPGKPGEVFIVFVRLNLLKIIDVEDTEGVLDSQIYLHYTWTDPRLKWDPKKFDNLTTVFIKPGVIWAPELLLDNNAKDLAGFKELTLQSEIIEVNYTGVCTFWPRFELTRTHCEIDVKWFPFDKQTCSFDYQSWLYRNNTVAYVKFVDQPLRLKYYVESELWDIVDTKVEESLIHDGHAFLQYIVHLRRKPLYYVFNLILPCFLLCFVCVFSALIQPSCGDRLGFRIYFMLYVIICLLAVFLTIITLYLHLRSETTPPTTMPCWFRRVLCIRHESDKSPRLQPRLSTKTIDTGFSNGKDNGIFTEFDPSENGLNLRYTNRRLLEAILRQLQTSDERQVKNREEAERDEELANDWKIAAVLIDRVFSIFLLICFVTSTLGIIIAFAVHDDD